MSTPTDTGPAAGTPGRRWIIRSASAPAADAASKLCIADPLKDDGKGSLTIDYEKIKAAKACRSPWTPAQAAAENGLRSDAAGLWVPPTGAVLYHQEIPEQSFDTPLPHGQVYYTDKWGYEITNKSAVLDLQVHVSVSWWINVYMQNSQALHSRLELFLDGDVKDRPDQIDENPWTTVGKIQLDDGSPAAFLDYYARLARSTGYKIPPGGTATFSHRVGLQFTSYSNAGATSTFKGNNADAWFNTWLVDPCYGLSEGKNVGPVRKKAALAASKATYPINTGEKTGA